MRLAHRSWRILINSADSVTLLRSPVDQRYTTVPRDARAASAAACFGGIADATAIAAISGTAHASTYCSRASAIFASALIEPVTFDRTL